MNVNGFTTRLIAAGLLIVGAVNAGADTRADMIALRPSASVAADGPITLGDIAVLRGDAAESLADVVLIENAAERFVGRLWCEIELADVRDALRERKPNWGRLALTGRACVVRLAAKRVEKNPSASRAYDRPEPQPVDLSGPPTVRSRIAATLASFFDVKPNDLRLLFDDRSADLLGRRTTGLRVEVKPTSMSRHAPVRVRLYEGERLLRDDLVRAEAEVRRRVVIAARDLPRSVAIEPDDVQIETMWLDPGRSTIGDLADVVGNKSRTRIEAGMPISPDRIEAPIVIRRGELVTVRCISGGIVLTAKARADRDARRGETIELRLSGSEKPFSARVEGRGHAIVNLDAQPDQSR